MHFYQQAAVPEARGAPPPKLHRVLRERARVHGHRQVDGGQVPARDRQQVAADRAAGGGHHRQVQDRPGRGHGRRGHC